MSRRLSENFGETCKWIGLYKDFMSVVKSFYRIGNKPLKFGEKGINPRDFRAHEDYLNNVKRDAIRKLCRSIINYAINNKCQIVVFEKLDMSDNQYDTEKGILSRDQNKLTSIWSARTIIETASVMAQEKGMIVSEAEPQDTSIIHYETKKIGYRGEGKDSANLHVADNKEVKNIDADINASKNIGYRYLTRHREFYSIIGTVEEKGDKNPKEVIISSSKKSGKDLGKRKQAFMSRMFDDMKSVKVSFDDNGKQIKAEEYKGKPFKNLTTIYLDGENGKECKTWMNMKGKKDIEEGIKSQIPTLREAQ